LLGLAFGNSVESVGRSANLENVGGSGIDALVDTIQGSIVSCPRGTRFIKLGGRVIDTLAQKRFVK
jgi:hypothetical protein